MLATHTKLNEAQMDDFINESIPTLDMVVHHDDLFNGAEAVMTALFPEWDRKDISYVQFKDGITNKRKIVCSVLSPRGVISTEPDPKKSGSKQSRP